MKDNKRQITQILDELANDLFSLDGSWYSNCFKRSNTIDEAFLPCHLRDANWLAELMIKKYELDTLKKDEITAYILTSSEFKELRDNYEQKIVSWQIDWMCSGGENWICENEFYMYSDRYDEIFRNGIRDTLIAIGMDSEAVEQGIENNVDKWREQCLKVTFSNIYNLNSTSVEIENFLRVVPNNTYSFFDIDKAENKLLSSEYYEKWRRYKLYKYYVNNKHSVDKYGEVLPEMQMTEEEALKLKEWLIKEHDQVISEIEDYKKTIISTESIMSEQPPRCFYDNGGQQNFLKEDVDCLKNKSENKIKSLVKTIFFYKNNRFNRK